MPTRRGQAPFGYRLASGKLHVVPIEAEVCRQAFDTFRDLRNRAQTAKALNEAGYLTRRRNPWTGVAIGRVLGNPAVIGEHTIPGSGDEASEVIPCDPIITRELWDQVQAILKEQSGDDKRKGREPVHLFGGLTFCSCGEKMYLRSDSPRFVCGTCKNKIAAEDLDRLFMCELTRLAPLCNSHASRSEVERNWNKLSDQSKRRTVDRLIERFVIAKGDTEIHYRFTKSIKDLAKTVQTGRASFQNPDGADDPLYVRLPSGNEQCSRTGLSRPFLNKLILPTEKNGFKPPVKSFKIVEPGKDRGVRLIIWESLKAYLDTQAKRNEG